MMPLFFVLAVTITSTSYDEEYSYPSAQIGSLVVSQVEPLKTNFCDAALGKMKALPEFETIKISDTDFEQKIQKKVVCVHSYPWPKGLFFIDEDNNKAITADQMGALAAAIDALFDNNPGEVERIARNYPEVISIDDKDEVIKRVVLYASGSQYKKDALQVKLYGAYLHLNKLDKEKRFADLFMYANKYISKFNLHSIPTNWDNAQAATYFSKETLGNFIILYKYRASSMLNDGTLEHKQLQLSEYSNIRDKLSAQIKFQSHLDSNEKLLANAGCATNTK